MQSLDRRPAGRRRGPAPLLIGSLVLGLAGLGAGSGAEADETAIAGSGREYIAAVQAEVAELEEKRETLEAAAAAAADRVAAAKAALDALSAAARAATDEADTAKTALQAAERQRDSLAAEIGRQRDELKRLETERQAAAQTEAAAGTADQTAVARREDAERAAAAAEARLADLRRDADAGEAELARLKSAIAAAEADRDTAAAEAATVAARRAADEKAAQEAREAADARASDAAAAEAAATKAADAAEARQAAAEAAAEKAKARQDAAEKAAAAAETHAAELDRKAAEAASAQASAETATRAAEARRQTAQTAADTAESRLAALQKGLVEAEGSQDERTRALSAAATRQAAAEAAAEAAEAEAAKLADRVTALRQAADQATRSRDGRLADAARAEADRQTATEALAAVEARISAARAEEAALAAARQARRRTAHRTAARRNGRQRRSRRRAVARGCLGGGRHRARACRGEPRSARRADCGPRAGCLRHRRPDLRRRHDQPADRGGAGTGAWRMLIPARRLLAPVLALTVALAALPAFAQSVATNLVAGPAGSTELRAGQDLAALAASCGLDLTVRESAGSIENMRAVRDRRATQLGIVQGDVLEYFRTFQADDPDLRRPARGVRVVFPLFSEEVHVIARHDVATLTDLTGKRVATGLPDSGTQITAGLILDLAQVEPSERLPLAPDAALDALRAGDVDAVIEVAGAPDARLVSAGLDPAAFHLLPLTVPALTAAYGPAEIAAGTYSFAPESVPVVAVPTYLVTFDFDPRANSYQAASCQFVADLGHLVVTRLDELRAAGHPKWSAADLTALPDGWQISPCLLDGIDPSYAFTCRKPDGTEVREGAADPASDDANQLYHQRICARLGGC